MMKEYALHVHNQYEDELNRTRTLTNIFASLTFEIIGKVINKNVIKIFTTKMSITSSSLSLRKHHHLW